MSVQHIYFNKSAEYGRMLKDGLRSLESGLENLNDVLAVMARMLDGDGSDDSHFTYLADKFGFTSNATARQAWNELNSLAAKLSTDNQVSEVNAALLQAFAKFR